MKYDHLAVEKKWQDFWQQHKTFKAFEDPSKEKYYALDMFPYPSGAGLHVGHPLGYTATDIISRKKRHEGYSVLHPMGWDAFGLPAENYAIKTGVHPKISTAENEATFKKQIQSLGFSYDWEREFSTTAPNYFKWSQWIFLQLYKKGLAYEKAMPMNWCPQCRIVAANEEVEQGMHERCGTAVEKRDLKQWMFRITDYAERLLNDLDDLPEWPEKIKAMQRNWIGRSEGAEVQFEIISAQKEKRGQKCCSNDNAVGPSQFTNIVWKNLVEVKQKKNKKLKFSNLKRVFKSNEKQYLFDGEVLINHFNLKNQNDRHRRMVWGRTIVSALDKLVWVSETEGWFISKNRVFKVIFSEIDKNNFQVKTFYDSKSLTREYLQWKAKSQFYKVNVYTTRPDTLFGATFVVLSPEHPLVDQITTDEQRSTVEAYKAEVAAKSDLERTELNKDKSGVFTGAFAINPVNGKEIPVWIADYVLMTYGTGAIMAVPAHDERDMEFAKKFDLEIVKAVMSPEEAMKHKEAEDKFEQTKDAQYLDISNKLEEEITEFYGGKDGQVTVVPFGEFHDWFEEKDDNSDKDLWELNNFRETVIQWLEKEGKGERKINYKLRDWIFTRQRYWGEPIPVVFDERGKPYPLDDSQLPLELPETPNYEPSEDGQSPLAKIEDWVKVKGYVTEEGTVKVIDQNKPPKSPLSGGLKIQNFTRETSTMPNWAGSSWYWLRFMDPGNQQEFCSKEKEQYWGPVDLYVGGAEHAVLHLLYGRFWHKVLYDLGYVSTKEPFKKLVNQGMIAAEDGRKMSKSLGNVINPDDVVKEYGADTLRCYEMFMGPFEQGKAWSMSSVGGIRKFLDRVHRYFLEHEVVDSCPDDKLISLTHQMVKKVGEDIDNFRFNTAISQMMVWMNEFSKLDHVPKIAGGKFIRCLSPFAPHLAEEIWNTKFKPGDGTIAYESWPSFDEKYLVQDTVTYAVQVNGKVRAELEFAKDGAKDDVITAARELEKVAKYLSEGEVRKEIFVPGKIVGFVVK